MLNFEGSRRQTDEGYSNRSTPPNQDPQPAATELECRPECFKLACFSALIRGLREFRIQRSGSETMAALNSPGSASLLFSCRLCLYWPRLAAELDAIFAMVKGQDVIAKTTRAESPTPQLLKLSRPLFTNTTDHSCLGSFDASLRSSTDYLDASIFDLGNDSYSKSPRRG